MYLLIYVFKLAPWRITYKKIQNECTARSKSFPKFKMLHSFINAMEMRHREDGRLPCSSAHKTKQGTTMSSTEAAFCRQSVNGLKEHNSKARPRSLQPHTGAGSDSRPGPWWMGLLPHTPLSSLWGEAAAGGRWLPPGNNLSHPKLSRTHPISSHGMAGRIFSMHS